MTSPGSGSSEASEVKVRVKSASHRSEDAEINVKEAKQLIKDQYPLHPVMSQTFIIYSYADFEFLLSPVLTKNDGLLRFYCIRPLVSVGGQRLKF
jgi:hypothetical protein